MNKLLLAAMTVAAVSAVHSQEPAPTWELGKNAIVQATTKDKIELVEGVVRLDARNSFEIPISVLGKQDDYTIEFEVKRGAGFKNLERMEGALRLIDFSDVQSHAGLALIYFPPAWDNNGGCGNAIGMDVNGYWADTCGGFVGDGFNKYTVVVKSKVPSIYRNGMLLAMTANVNPSDKPISVGGAGWAGRERYGQGNGPVPIPYELRNLKIYDKAVMPTGYDKSAEVMRNVSGEGYSIQRADVKDTSLPRILVIGDSISMGYRGFITKHFKGKAYVDYWVGGSWLDPNSVKGENSKVKTSWTGVLSNGPYDVISWNSMTLHMWGSAHPGRCLESNHAENVAEVIDHIRKRSPTSKLIWIRCTPCTIAVDGGPSLVDEKKSERLVKFNKITDEVMVKHGIPEVDLYALCEKNLDKASKDGVHWEASASALMADEIIKEIEKSLPPKNIGNIVGQAKKPTAPGKLKVMQCWDDSLTTDIPLVKLLGKHKAKATFNIIPMKERRSFIVKKLTTGKETLFSFMPRGTEDGFKVEHLNNEEMKDVYKGFTVAAHCGFSNDETPEAVEPRRRVLTDTMAMIKENFHQNKVGFVYPGGAYNKTVMQAVHDAGYLYARTTKSADAPLPLNTPMELPTSCHWNNPQFWDKYEAAKKKGGVFYFWGHSCELGDGQFLWDKLESIYARISADPDAEWIDVIDLDFDDAAYTGKQ